MRPMRTGRVRRRTRAGGPGVAAAAGGGGLPARTTAPTLKNANFTGYTAGTTFAFGTTNTTGDLCIAMLNHFSQIIPTETLTVTNVDTVTDQISLDMGGASGWTGISRVATKISTGGADTGSFSGVTLSTTAALFDLSAVFDTGTFDGSPTVLLQENFDENQLGEMTCTTGVTPLRITFPTYAVPTGYMFLYGIITEDNLQGAHTWTTATNQAGGSNTSGDDSNLTIASITGPSDGAGVVVEFAGYSGFFQGGAAAFIVAVPGT